MKLLVLHHRPINVPLIGASRLIVDTYASLSKYHNVRTLIATICRVNYRTNINGICSVALKILNLPESIKLKLSLLPTRLLLKVFGESFLPAHVVLYVNNVKKSIGEARRLAEKYEPDVIVAEQCYVAPLALSLARELDIPCMLREHNIEFMYLYNVSNSISRRFVSRFRNYEVQLVSSFDKTLFISLREFKYMLKLKVPESKILFTEPLIMKHGVNLGSKYISTLGLIEENYVLYVASSHKPNMLGLYRIINAAKEVPNVDFVVCGTICNVIPKDLRSNMPSNIKILGTVSDDQLRTLYEYSKLVFAPLPHGTGIPIKLIEALIYGKPVVTTDNVDGTLPMISNNTIPMTDLKYIDKLLVKVLLSSQYYERLKDVAKEISKYFNEEEIARKYVRILESLA